MVKQIIPRIFLPVMSTGAIGVLVSLFGKNWLKLASAIVWIALFLFFLFSILYIIKILKYFNSFLEELKHPMMSNFFAAIYISIGVLITGILKVLIPAKMDFGIGLILAKFLYILGIAIILPIIILVPALNFISEKVEPKHLLGFWYLPPVGLFVFIFAGNFLAMEGIFKSFIIAFNAFLFGVAFFWWLVRAVLIFYRMKFHPLPPSEFAPNFVIGLAPAAVSAIAIITYALLTKNDLLMEIAKGFAVISYGYGLWWGFIALLVLAYYIAYKEIKYSLGFWAFVFPPAAFAIGAKLVSQFEFSNVFLSIFYAFGFLAILTWIYVSIKSLINLMKKQKKQAKN